MHKTAHAMRNKGKVYSSFDMSRALLHGYQGISADHTTVKHGTVADMAILFNDRAFIRKAVKGAGILDIGTCFDHNSVKIAAQTRAWAYVATRTDNDVAD